MLPLGTMTDSRSGRVCQLRCLQLHIASTTPRHIRINMPWRQRQVTQQNRTVFWLLFTINNPLISLEIMAQIHFNIFAQGRRLNAHRDMQHPAAARCKMQERGAEQTPPHPCQWHSASRSLIYTSPRLCLCTLIEACVLLFLQQRRLGALSHIISATE